MSDENSDDSNSDPIMDLCNAVHDEKTFCEFLLALSQDWDSEKCPQAEPMLEPTENGWENHNIYQFLEAASAFGLTWLELDDTNRSDNVWRQAARIMYAGKYYE